MVDSNVIHEAMIDCFLSLEGEEIENKDARGILMAWVTWIDSRYKVAAVPDVCYAIIDCEDGELVSMVRADIPGAKEQANAMCASLNERDSGLKYDEPSEKDMLDPDQVAEAFASMDEESFMDFLLGIQREKEE